MMSDRKVAIVTGGAQGIGRAIALDFARCGVHVAFNFLDEGPRSRLESRVLRSVPGLDAVRSRLRPCGFQELGSSVKKMARPLEPLKDRCGRGPRLKEGLYLHSS